MDICCFSKIYFNLGSIEFCSTELYQIISKETKKQRDEENIMSNDTNYAMKIIYS